MITKLSDYLDYLYNEVIQARKQADLASIKMAKEYANDAYLKFFKAPRFAFPSVKLEIPIKITDIDGKVKYDFKMDETKFLETVNTEIIKKNKESNLSIKTITPEDIQTENFQKKIKTIETKDQRFTKLNSKNLSKLDKGQDFSSLFRRGDFIKTDDANKESQIALNQIVQKALLDQFVPVEANLKNIFIDPNTSSPSDKDKIMVKLFVEMVDEGVKINYATDAKGNKIEEITID